MAKKTGAKSKATPRRPSKGRRLSKDDKVALAMLICADYATGQYTIHSCLKKHGVKSEATWINWLKEVEEIEELYEKAKQEKELVYEEELVKLSKTMLQRHLEGITLEETVEHGEQQKDGTIITKKVVRKTKEKSPSLTAAMYVLNNFRPHKFSSRPQPRKNKDAGLPFTGSTFKVIRKPSDLDEE